jgi:hypothetical protein
MTNFQFNSKSIFLTFSQCEFPLDQFLQKIESFFHGNLEKGVISQEKHQDGNYHLHAAICLERPFRSRDPRVFDSLVDPPVHPNINGKFKAGVLKAFQYVMKDGNFEALNEPAFNLTSFMEAATKKKSTRSKIISEELMDPTNKPVEVMENHADFMLLNLKKVQAFVDWRQARVRQSQYAEAQTHLVRVRPADGYSSSWNSEIASWLNANLRMTRPHRTKQLWICAPPRMGKTSLIMMLEETFKLSTYYWPRDEKWWDGYSDNEYDWIVLDEFFTQKTITELNPILSGDPVPLSRRGLSPIVKRQNLPVIILSNYTPEECFTRVAVQQPHKIAPLLDRLTVVKAEGPIRIVPVTQDEPSLTVTPFILSPDPIIEPEIAPRIGDIVTCPECVEQGRPAEWPLGHVTVHYDHYHGSHQNNPEGWSEFSRLQDLEWIEDQLETFNRNNDPYYFDKVSRQGRATLLASRNQ